MGSATGVFALSIVVLLVNYSSMKKSEKRVREERDLAHSAANTDLLTGVKSKHAFSMQESAMEKQIAEGEAGTFAVIICDVNGLKKINDPLGHKAGDEYIRSVCRLSDASGAAASIPGGNDCNSFAFFRFYSTFRLFFPSFHLKIL